MASSFLCQLWTLTICSVGLERRLSLNAQGQQMSEPGASVSGGWFCGVIGRTNEHDQSLAAFTSGLLQREEDTVEKALTLMIDTGKNGKILAVNNPAFAVKSPFEMLNDRLGKCIAVKAERATFPSF